MKWYLANDTLSGKWIDTDTIPCGVCICCCMKCTSIPEAKKSLIMALELVYDGKANATVYTREYHGLTKMHSVKDAYCDWWPEKDSAGE